MVTYYKQGSGYIAVTSKSPKGFKGIVFVGRGGDLGSITEQAFAVPALAKLSKVALADVPAEWVVALGYDQPLIPDEIVEEEFPLLDTEGENLEALITLPVRRRAAQALPDAEIARQQRAQIIGLLIGAAIALFFVWFNS